MTTTTITNPFPPKGNLKPNTTAINKNKPKKSSLISENTPSRDFQNSKAGSFTLWTVYHHKLAMI